MITHMHKTTLAATALAMMFVAGQPAHAQGDANKSDSDQLETVTVTARYQTENLQTTPIAITALNADQLEQRGYQNIVDVTNSAPNVTLQMSGANGGKSAVAYIRGMGQSDFTLSFEPGVGFYMDDVYFGTIFGAMFDLTDVDHVEVLRGPQGTLFGKNSEGGAVRIFTKQPTGSDSGYLQAGYGSYNHWMVKGAYDFAIIPDKLYLRLSGGTNRYDGYVTRYDFVCLHPALSGNLPQVTSRSDCKLGTEGGDKADFVRANIRWMPTSNLEVRLSADLLNDRGEAPPNKTLLITPGGALGDYNTNVLLNPASGFYTGVPIDSRFVTNSPYTTYSTFIERSIGKRLSPVNNVYSWGVSNTVLWTTPWDGIQVKNVLAYRAYQGNFVIDVTGAPLSTVMYSNPEFIHHQTSEELNVSGKAFGDTLDWTVGAYYYDGFSKQGNGPVLLTSAEIVPPTGIPFFCTTGCYGLNFITNDPVQVYNKSLFVHAVYHFNDQLSLEAGVRYSDESKKYTFTRRLLPINPPNIIFSPAFDPDYPALAGFANHPSATSKTFRFDPKVALQYQWTPNIMSYVQYSTGYKGGGINPHPVFLSQVQPFKDETLDSYEIGAKTQWFNNRLRLNLAGFIAESHNLQITVIGAAGADIVKNAKQVEITGLEGEMDAEPIPGLLLNGSFGYLNYDYVNLGPAFGFPGAPGLSDRPPYIPTWQYSLGVQYAIDLNDLGVITPRLDWSWKSSFYNDPSNDPRALQKAYGLMNVRVTYDTPDDKWEAALEIKNALDKVYYVNMYDDLGSFNTLDGQPGWPRTVFFSLKRRI